MVDVLIRPDQRTDVVSIGGSPRARAWTLAVGLGLHSGHSQFAWPTSIPATGIEIGTAPITSATVGDLRGRLDPDRAPLMSPVRPTRCRPK
jgi:hypothetical protein